MEGFIAYTVSCVARSGSSGGMGVCVCSGSAGDVDRWVRSEIAGEISLDVYVEKSK